MVLPKFIWNWKLSDIEPFCGWMFFFQKKKRFSLMPENSWCKAWKAFCLFIRNHGDKNCACVLILLWWSSITFQEQTKLSDQYLVQFLNFFNVAANKFLQKQDVRHYFFRFWSSLFTLVSCHCQLYSWLHSCSRTRTTHCCCLWPLTCLFLLLMLRMRF